MEMCVDRKTWGGRGRSPLWTSCQGNGVRLYFQSCLPPRIFMGKNRGGVIRPGMALSLPPEGMATPVIPRLIPVRWSGGTHWIVLEGDRIGCRTCGAGWTSISLGEMSEGEDVACLEFRTAMARVAAGEDSPRRLWGLAMRWQLPPEVMKVIVHWMAMDLELRFS